LMSAALAAENAEQISPAASRSVVSLFMTKISFLHGEGWGISDLFLSEPETPKASGSEVKLSRAFSLTE
jgi:hypothetical protein